MGPLPHWVECVTVTPSSEGNTDLGLEFGVDTRQPRAVGGTFRQARGPEGWRAGGHRQACPGAPGLPAVTCPR